MMWIISLLKRSIRERDVYYDLNPSVATIMTAVDNAGLESERMFKSWRIW
jgi:hypothetical protein